MNPPHTPRDYKKATVFSESGPDAVGYGWNPDDEEIELLKYLITEGIVMSSSRFGGLGFAELIEGAKGRMPWTVKFDKNGDYDVIASTEDGDDIVIANAQQWSVLRAYKLGYEQARLEFDWGDAG